MAEVWPAIAAALTAASSIGNIASSIWGVNKQEELQREAWSREDNAVQRRVADLKAAGLNPVLAAGSAASSSGPINVGRPSFSGLGEGAVVAMEMMRQKADISRTIADKERTELGTKFDNWLKTQEMNLNEGALLKQSNDIHLGDIARKEADLALQEHAYNYELARRYGIPSTRDAAGVVGQLINVSRIADKFKDAGSNHAGYDMLKKIDDAVGNFHIGDWKPF